MVEVPAHLLTEQEMIGMLVDVHIAEAKIRELGVPRDSSRKLFRRIERDLFKKYQVNDSIYVASFQFYLNTPDRMVEIYSAVVDSLSLRQKLKNID